MADCDKPAQTESEGAAHPSHGSGGAYSEQLPLIMADVHEVQQERTLSIVDRLLQEKAHWEGDEKAISVHR